MTTADELFTRPDDGGAAFEALNLTATTTTTDNASHALTATAPDYANAYDGDGGDASSDYTPHELRLRLLWLYGGYPILVVGTVGHVLAIATLLAKRSMRTMPLAVFLLPMSAAGLAALYAGLLRTVVRYQTYDTLLLEGSTGSEVACRLHMAAVYASLQLYSWMETCVAVERLVAVRWPHRYRHWFTRRRNMAAVGAATAVVLSLAAVPYLAYGHSPEGFCELVDERLFNGVWRYVHWAAYAALPVAVMLPCNALVLHTMCHPRFSRNSNVRKARPVTVMMLSLNGVFFVTTVPIMVGDWGGGDDVRRAREAEDVVWAVCRLLMYLGSAATFAVYLVIGAKFRVALRELLESSKSGLLRLASVLSGGAYQPESAAGRGGCDCGGGSGAAAAGAAASAESEGSGCATTTEKL